MKKQNKKSAGEFVKILFIASLSLLFILHRLYKTVVSKSKSAAGSVIRTHTCLPPPPLIYLFLCVRSLLVSTLVTCLALKSLIKSFYKNRVICAHKLRFIQLNGFFKEKVNVCVWTHYYALSKGNSKQKRTIPSADCITVERGKIAENYLTFCHALLDFYVYQIQEEQIKEEEKLESLNENEIYCIYYARRLKE